MLTHQILRPQLKGCPSLTRSHRRLQALRSPRGSGRPGNVCVRARKRRVGYRRSIEAGLNFFIQCNWAHWPARRLPLCAASKKR